ncbi:MAG: hypothetical protein ABF888_04105 [Acetobacter papayae]|uniref:hypothetical protein n=1 Tax=Acetobacter papayae TaxID=1076592 RepID=UPI0039EC2216
MSEERQLSSGMATFGFAVLVLDLAVGIGFVLVPLMIVGFLSLLRDVFGVLLLPFSFLLGLAGWSADQKTLHAMQTGFLPDGSAHMLRAGSIILLLAVSILCSVLASRRVGQSVCVERWLAPCLTGIAAWLGGGTLALVLLPAFFLQCAALRYPGLRIAGAR